MVVQHNAQGNLWIVLGNKEKALWAPLSGGGGGAKSREVAAANAALERVLSEVARAFERRPLQESVLVLCPGEDRTTLRRWGSYKPSDVRDRLDARRSEKVEDAAAPGRVRLDLSLDEVALVRTALTHYRAAVAERVTSSLRDIAAEVTRQCGADATSTTSALRRDPSGDTTEACDAALSKLPPGNPRGAA